MQSNKAELFDTVLFFGKGSQNWANCFMWSHTSFSSHTYIFERAKIKIKDKERDVNDRLSLMNDLIKMQKQQIADWFYKLFSYSI